MCGIFGILNKSPRPFDFSTFCMLGIENDSRGGDSCGVFIDGKYEYGVNKEKLFADFFQESELIYKTNSATIALGHCRKASVGKISKETAQPVIIKDDLGNVKFVVIHNGTIHNYTELAKKYIPNIDITGMTDSQVMTHIFYHKGYDVLEEYNGGAVFCIVDYRGYTPRTYLWKGASKKNEFSKDIEDERPLWFVHNPLKRELVFSSLWIPLKALRKEATIFTPVENTLIEFEGTRVKVVKEYSRANCIQTKKYETKSSSYLSGYSMGSWYGGSYTSCFVTVDFDRNIYTYLGKPLHGRFLLGKYGRVYEKESVEAVYNAFFYNGVLLRSEECYKFLTKLQSKLKMSDADFFKKFWNVIRYLSYDRIYNNGGFYYIATSPTKSDLFTGKLEPIGTTTSLNINDGKRGATVYGGRDHEETLEKFKSTKCEINFKEIKKLCKSLMS